MLRFSPIVLAAVLLLSGCSAVQLPYNNADWWLTRQFSQYFDLDGAQRNALRAQLQQRMEQHRQHELADTVALLDGWYRAFERGLDRATVEQLMVQADAVITTSLEQSVLLVAGVMVELDTDQQAHFESRLARLSRDFRQRYRLDEPPARRMAEREQQVIERIEDWTGRLSGSQRGELSAHIATWPELSEHWLAYRERKQGELLELLRSEPTAEQIAAFLHAWLTLSDQPSELRDGNSVLRGQLKTFLITLDRSLSSRQRQQLLSRVDNYRQALASLVPEEPQVATLHEH